MLTSSKIFFDAAKSGLSFDHLKPEDLGFLDASFFDCDGCLLDSESLAMGDLGQKIDEAVKKAGHEAGLNNPDFIAAYAGWHADEIIKDIAGKAGIVLDRAEIMTAHKSSVIDTLKREVVTFDGMEGVLSFMSKAAHGKQAVITSSELARVAPGLEKNNLLQHFHGGDGAMHVYSAPDLMPDFKKPFPHIYQHGMKIFDAEPARTSTMEDSSSGVKSAVAAGVGYVIGFVGGSHIAHNRKQEAAENLLNLGAHTVIRDVREYPLAILQLLRERQLKASPSADISGPEPRA